MPNAYYRKEQVEGLYDIVDEISESFYNDNGEPLEGGDNFDELQINLERAIMAVKNIRDDLKQ